MAKFVTAYESEFVKNLVVALGIDTEIWRRIIIDITANELITVYVEMFTDDDKLKLVPPDVISARILMTKTITDVMK